MIPATDEFNDACAEMGIELETGEPERLRSFLDLLYQANETTNLTAIKDEHEAWMKHIFDALTLLPDGRLRFNAGCGLCLLGVITGLAVIGIRDRRKEHLRLVIICRCGVILSSCFHIFRTHIDSPC